MSLNKKLREEFFSKYPNFHHTDEDGHEYAIMGGYNIDDNLYREIEKASEMMYKIMLKAQQQILNLDRRKLIKMGYDGRLIDFLNIDCGMSTPLTCRFDLIRNMDTGEFKFIELNHVTPLFLIENFRIAEDMFEFMGSYSLTNGREEMLRKRLLGVLMNTSDYLGKKLSSIKIAIASCSEKENREEFCTAKFLQELIIRTGLNVSLVEYNQILIDDEEEIVYTDETGLIDILFMPAYPLDFLINDTYIDSKENIGLDLLNLVKDKKVALINPPKSFILENKSVFSFLWDSLQIFDEDEIEFIKKHVPVTAMREGYLKARKLPFLTKDAIGRNGHQETGSTLIYQEVIPPNLINIFGYEEFEEILSSFLINGESAGVISRLGQDIHWINIH